jgi:multicomponent K+:H+ antiporter subunit A
MEVARLLPLVALLPLVGAALPALLSRTGRGVAAMAAGAVSLASLAVLLACAGSLPVTTSVTWVPALGLSFSFMLDGLSLFFALIILGIGLLIILYARYYLSPRDDAGRFYAYLLLFQGAMLGIVTSDNVLLLVVFWELTSLSSFLLIGFWHHLPEGRQGARMALVVTGAGGLALIGGMILLGQAAGSFELSAILKNGEAVRASPLYRPILLLVLAGAFTKSAQFPFHFWLPHAMAAPTPVSAYLHSATMVKAGVFLMARLWPVLAGTPEWTGIVSGAGLATMLVAAWIALFKTDLKAILAFSTVSHLGLMTMLLGFGTPYAAVACVFHILNHALFKAALFMSAGIVDHETGTRDIDRLGGLIRLMPISGALSLLASAAMAGLPLTNGFLSKEMMLEASLGGWPGSLDWAVPLLATLGALLSVAYSVRLGAGVFLGRPRYPSEAHPHDPPPGMWLPIAVLVGPAIAIGLIPGLAQPLVMQTAAAVLGPAPLPDLHFAIWHGMTPAFGLSLAAMAGGALAWWGWGRLQAVRLSLPRPDAKHIFDRSVAAGVRLSRQASDAIHNGSLSRILFVVLVASASLASAGWLSTSHSPGARETLDPGLPALIGFVILMAACLLTVAYHRSRMTALAMTGVAGLIVSVAFLQFSAPDLALTQISVEVVAAILLLLALNVLPKTTPAETRPARVVRDGVLAILCGIGIGGLAYAVMTRDADTIASFHIANAKPGGGGTNIVNVTLVDFRGFDTFGEIIVLCIAALVIYALLDTALRGAAARRLDAMRPMLEAGDAHPLLFAVATRLLMPLALTVGLFIVMRGHNEPGGGFFAGHVIANDYLMQYMASGYDFAVSRRRVLAHTLLGSGVLIAGLTGLAAVLLGRPFLTSTYGYVTWPIVGTFELASAMAFDLGVFLTVIGTVMLSLAQIARIEKRADRSVVPEGPMDIRPVLTTEDR